MSYDNCQHLTEWSVSTQNLLLSSSVTAAGLPDDFASPGYFSTNLSNSNCVELTATQRTAIHRYAFPAETANPRLLVDTTNDGQKSGTNPVMTLDLDTARDEGGASFATGQYNVRHTLL